MRLLITGATGFIGRHLVAHLVDSGANVVALVKDNEETGRLPPSLLARSDRLALRFADLRDESAVVAAVRRADPQAILHLAAAGVTDPFLNVHSALNHNVVGTLNLLRASFQDSRQQQEVSSFVIARTPGERTAMNPYAASKAAAWQFCLMYARTEGWPIRGAMIFQAYGSGQADSALVPAAVRAAKQDEDFPMTSGAQVRDWIHVRDVVQGLVSTLQAPLSAGTTVELGTGRPTTVAEVVSLIYERAQSNGRPLPAAVPNRPGEASRQVADAVVTERLIGWKAETTLQDGLDELISKAK